ncbi:DUF6612 family protein [Bacillus kwashiorkori]|uniref:DUF6612 family protein n=1 Tax=Bacillus kwashiorkori TaxID=1522318 RepID=UPI0007838B38|nr:DUF6612 family protein [Bacillus kwashiorkori]
MKKWIQILFIGIVLLFISACGTTAKPTGDGKVSGNSSLTLEQVYEKSLTATSNLKSVTLNMDMLQKMQFGADSEPISITMNTDADVLIDPLSMHQTIRMEGMEVTPETEVELYLTQDGVYFFAPESNEWIKMPNEMYEEISQMPTNQLDINEQLKVLQQFIKDFTFEQNDNHYILHLNAAGDKFKDIMKELAPISETAVLGELDILDMFHN